MGARDDMLNFVNSGRMVMENGSVVNIANILYGCNPVTKTLTRPNDTIAYSAGDVIGTATSSIIEFQNVGPAGSKIRIDEFMMLIETNAVPSGMSGFKFHLYNAAPTTIADNLSFNLAIADKGKYQGFIPVGLPIRQGDTLLAQESNLNKIVTLVTTSLFGVLETAGAFTPTANCIKNFWMR